MPFVMMTSFLLRDFRAPTLNYWACLCGQTVFEHTKAKFDQLVQSGQVLQHYTHVLQFLLRLRQACNHPLLPSYREEQRRQQFIDAVRPVQEISAYRSKDTLTGQHHIPSVRLNTFQLSCADHNHRIGMTMYNERHLLF